MSGDDNREWTVHVCKDCGAEAHCFDRCSKDRRRVWTEVVPVPVVPRSRLERAEAERDALRLEVDALRRDHGRLQQAMKDTDDIIKELL